VLTGGEDHALLACFPAAVTLPSGWTRLGAVYEGTGVTVNAQPYEAAPGWVHFKS
jgi:thiamine-monophosphate kinase